MDLAQARDVLRVMAATWPGEMTDDQVTAWIETLAEIKPAHARQAIRDLKRVKTFTPTHADFYEAVQVCADRDAAQDEERQLGEAGGTRCPNDCTDGFVPITETGKLVVERCDHCNPAPDPKAEHSARCTCSRCHYGPKRMAAIRGGYDGMAAPRRLETVPPPTEEF